MPIDPSIPLSIRPPAPGPSILDTYQQITQLQAQKAAGEERRAAAAEAQAKRQREAQIEQAMREAVTVGPDGQPTIDYAKLLPHVPPAALFEVKKQIDATAEQMVRLKTANLTQAEKVTTYLGGVAKGVRAAGDDPKAFQLAVVGAQKAGAVTQQEADALLDEVERDPAAVTRWTTRAIGALGQEPKLAQVQTLEGGVAGTRFVPEQAGTFYPSVPKASDPPAVGSFEDYVVRRFGATPTSEQITQARKDYQQADDRPRITVNAGGPGGVSDVKDIVQGMIDGTLPPQLPGRASPAYNAIMAEAQRRGYDLARAVTDWTATQKHTATLNGAQQLRLNQAVNALPEMLDSVSTLAKQWKAGRFPVLNRVSLAAAKHGVYGQQAATIANQLDAQIADVVADLGNVYMGGNSPTDHALMLAGKSLSADWDEAVLLKMVDLAKKNVQIRRNSINSTGVAGASEGNPYAPAAPTGPPVDTSGGRGAGPGMTYQDYLRSQGSR